MEKDLNLKDTELRLGLPGTDAAVRGSKRASADENPDSSAAGPCQSRINSVPATKVQVVGWPPIRSSRRNSFSQQGGKKHENQENGVGMMYVKVSMDGAPYLRKIDIKGYKGYSDLLNSLQSMFKFTLAEYSETEGYTGSDFVPTYEDKDGDWMLVGDVPWEMFTDSCKRLRIMKGSEAKGLASNL